MVEGLCLLTSLSARERAGATQGWLPATGHAAGLYVHRRRNLGQPEPDTSALHCRKLGWTRQAQAVDGQDFAMACGNFSEVAIRAARPTRCGPTRAPVIRRMRRRIAQNHSTSDFRLNSPALSASAFLTSIMPHFGQLPIVAVSTSGWSGQVNSCPLATPADSVDLLHAPTL